MSDDERSGADWVFYKDRPQWNDVTPVPQDDGPNPVVAIAYSEKFKDVYDYFRAVLKSEEKSQRALDLTKDALDLNPANYTVWQYRRELLQALEIDLQEELCYLQQVIDSNPKNYQIWHHRRVMVEWLKDPSLELQLTENILDQDPKNYHAWQHRQWVIKTFGLYDKELFFVEELLSADIRNNSAWNQRYFVISNTTGFTESVIEFEVNYTIEKIKFVKTNESAWNYLRGVLFYDERGLIGNPALTSFCQELYKNSNRSPYLLAMIIDICLESSKTNNSDPVFNASRGIELCDEMANKFDKIRCKYWKYISNKFIPKKKAEEKPHFCQLHKPREDNMNTS